MFINEDMIFKRKRDDWVQFDHLCKEKLTLDRIELYEDLLFCLLMFYVILLRVVCQEPRQSRRKVVSPGLTRNIKMH